MANNVSNKIVLPLEKKEQFLKELCSVQDHAPNPNGVFFDLNKLISVPKSAIEFLFNSRRSAWGTPSNTKDLILYDNLAENELWVIFFTASSPVNSRILEALAIHLNTAVTFYYLEEGSLIYGKKTVDIVHEGTVFTLDNCEAEEVEVLPVEVIDQFYDKDYDSYSELVQNFNAVAC